MNTLLAGFGLAVSEHLRGSKRAVKSGDTIYVSPAMYDLIRHAEGEELRRLLVSIPLLDVGEPFDIRQPLPMTTTPFDKAIPWWWAYRSPRQ